MAGSTARLRACKCVPAVFTFRAGSRRDRSEDCVLGQVDPQELPRPLVPHRTLAPPARTALTIRGSPEAVDALSLLAKLVQATGDPARSRPDLPRIHRSSG